MDVRQIKGIVPYEMVESLEKRGLEKFTPPQEAAISSGLLEGNSIVVASPTASGKTLVAELAAAYSIIAKGKKAVYIAPMRALVEEKYSEFKAAYPYIKSVMSIGDMDSNDPWLSNYSMIFVSTEKFDSLIRHGIDWLPSVGCIVFDEVHMLDDPSRGATLELLMTKLKDITDAQMIALSATIGNANEIAEWMGAKLVESDYRPVKLRKGVVLDNKVYYKLGRAKAEDGGSAEELKGGAQLQEIRVVEDTLRRGKQALVFYSSRRNAEAGAERIGAAIGPTLTADDKIRLNELSERVLGVLESPTQQCIKLARAVKNGVAFHHAGLLNSQRGYIEQAFRDNIIKAVCSTTTLGLGVNLPAHTVLVKEVHRYDGFGSSKIGINEVTQLFGRAGRPKYDTEGRALLLATSKELMKRLYKEYIEGELEPVSSSLGIAPILRTHILAFIAEDFLNSVDSINAFMAKTFYGFQYRDLWEIKQNVRSILMELGEWEFIEDRNGELVATRLGRRVSELYIDPLSAKWIVDSLKKQRDIIGSLFMITNTLEMRPYVKATEEGLSRYVMYRSTMPSTSIFDSEGSFDYAVYEPERAFTTALMLYDWMDEVHEKELVEKYSITPGALYVKLTNADWLVYSSIELAKLVHVPIHDLVNVNVRLKYGIKEELLNLVRLEQIGRVRARALFNNGIHTIEDIRNSREKVARVLGKDIAQKVFSQID